jgi:RND family efflux transporter MFP subunit
MMGSLLFQLHHLRIVSARPLCLLTTALVLPLLGVGCGQGHTSKEPKAVEVVVTKSISDQVSDYQDFMGRLSAVEMVNVRARVSGYVIAAYMKEGELVKKGAELFKIDPIAYQADLNLAQANLKLAEAEQNVQEKNAARAHHLVRTKALSQEDYETIVATLEKDRAAVEAKAASRDRSKQYLDWTMVTAPISGRIGQRLVDPGNLVNADNTIMTTIVSEGLMYVYFDVDERTYLNLVHSTSPGLWSWLSALQFPVLLQLANEEEFTHEGTVKFIDNQVNPGTGTIKMRAEFPNPRGALKPGLFARVRLPIGSAYSAVLIPDEAIMTDQGRKFAYVVNDKNEVVYRKLTLGHALGKLRVVKEGLAEGERVIVSGTQRVREGIQVVPQIQEPPARPESPLAKLLNKTRGAEARSQRPDSGGPGKGTLVP